MAYSVLVDIHVYSVEPRRGALTKFVPLIDTDEAFKDRDICTIAFSVTRNVSDHFVGFEIAGRSRSAMAECEEYAEQLTSHRGSAA